ncbi:N-acetyltransferase family protein [Labrys sp. KB_33_2]|uniref:GNAT family N-acetyltransferase n=1 Tax=unclassified Labrys (in: a-proteobacteria) TaxID=2688601 RepID=UPI003EBB8C1C
MSAIPSLSVRIGGKADLPAVLTLYGQPDFNGDNVLTLEEAEDKLQRLGLYPDYTLHVVEQDGRIIGTFCLMAVDNLARRGTPFAVIENVVIASDKQGEGIGRLMLQAAFRLAQEKGCYKAILASSLHNTGAHAFYDSLGFERHGVSFRLSLPEKVA